MPQLVPIRCLTDNYAYLLHGMGETVLFDAPEAAPILSELAARGWRLDRIVLTHHHDDHAQAVPALVAATGARVAGNAADAARLPPLDDPLRVGAPLTLAGESAEVIDVPGHTIGHIAIHLPRARLCFTGDSLMAMGCGRLFEGTPAQMWESLGRLNALAPDTLICSGHDYARSNGGFARMVDPGNAALAARLDDIAQGRAPTAPATLATERATNPFLRTAELAPGLGLADAPPAEVFARLRTMRDGFQA